ncbi:GGDEF domain-containing protein [Actimicrobium sp. CCI2.3]|uniref:GGDEF domain-containing protein n=1 Tax=Actimicrobium sp. CCI2.3 TaxID=3048616 RepID=UPI002AB57EF9|nr:GGDEF domain-containing protein [Actimicrobium sp. CCI2.3]MDY7576510.1 GGDEF domain-containing protein [Actimicrobium sp. CCI2.3]MEB0021512.1 GGDEF domain-containing protein [Actimicrobium sp. CCI2.3]
MIAEPNAVAEIALLRQQLAATEEELRTLRSSISSLIRHDALTGVLNRRTLIEALRTELQRSHRTAQPFCLAIVDLDHFKHINEQCGTATGDLVLKTLADTAQKLLRGVDRFGRLGGEEFGIVMPATWLDSGVTAMTRLRAAVAACDWPGITGRTDGTVVTFSAGVTINAPAYTVSSLMQRAEAALLQAKLDGRNCTAILEEPLPDMTDPDD